MSERESLWPQLRLKADSEAELMELYRKVYLETYVYDEQGNRRIFTDWAGCSYQFSPFAFEHAFTESDNYRTSAGVHHKFSLKRARRILWIKEVLALSAGTVQRFAQSRSNDRGNQVKRRTFVVVEERYVVVFDDPKSVGKPYEFVTAFPADQAYLDNLKRRSFLVETKRGG